MRRLILIMLAAILTASIAAAQVTVSGTVGSTNVALGERFTFTIEVTDADVGDVVIARDPWTTGLVALSRRPAVSHSIDVVNRQLQQTVRYRWTYEPLAPGEATIDAVEVVVRGETYRTDPVQLTVLSAAERLRESLHAPQPAVAPEEVFIEGRASTVEAFVNEQVIIEYRLFYREGVQLRQSRMAGSWDTPGFWREDLEVDLRPVPERHVVNGLHYNSIVLKRAAAFPTRDGRLRIEPFRIESEVRIRTGDPRDPFAAYRNRFRAIEIASNPIDVQVRPLPPNAPASFRGAVGHFAMQERRGPSELQTGDAYSVELAITGTGNFAMLDAPRVVLPEAFDRFDPVEEVRFERRGSQPRGRKSFTLSAVPLEPGEFVLPATAFTFFNPEDGRYETIFGDSVVVRVRGEAMHSGVDDALPAVHAVANWDERTGRPLYRQPWAYLPALAPLAAWLLLPGVRGLRRRRVLGRRARAHREAISQTRQSLARLRDHAAKDRIREVERAVAAPALALAVHRREALISRLEAARYAPPALRQDLIDAVIRDLDALLASAEAAA